MHIVENGKMVTEETPSRKRKQSKGKAKKWNDEEKDLDRSQLQGLCQVQ